MKGNRYAMREKRSGKFDTIINNEYVFSIITKVLVIISGFIYSVIFNRYLGAELKGEIAYILNFISVLVCILGVGVHQAYPFYKKEYGEKHAIKVINSSIFLFIAYILFAIIAICIYRDNFYVITIALLFPFNLISMHLAYYTMVYRPLKANRINIILSISNIIIIAVLSIFTHSTQAIVVLFLIIQTLFSIIFNGFVLKIHIKNIKFNIKETIKVIKFGIIPMLAVLMMTLNYKVDIFMLNGSVDFAQIGIYSLAVSLAEKIWVIPDALRDILMSKLTNKKGAEEVAKVIRLTLIPCIILVGVIAIVGEPLIDILYGTDFNGAYSVTVIIMIGMIPMIFYKMIATYNIVNRLQKNNLLFLGISTIVNIVLNYKIIPIMGINGAALSSVVSYTICGGMFLLSFIWKTKIRFNNVLIIQKEDITLLKAFIKGDRNEDRDINIS